ncbi:uncharacterized protein CDV56_100577 [Aspergillus thermomutatus]|uniref:Uncharacterized protein n=1 Tax=Aspergillus thermomutatus TaxID=41047 RepID=A0A397G3H4_ASPTH|nr:uncharacterized protein CDV56_100577 [Aspergillus thermomutatus]RHZ43886.1 hypothetical protein CDV56_100577 [Aspergillus thermomutatus]
MYPLGNNNQISLSTQLVQQLIQFQGCCQDCHTQIRVKQDQVRKSELSLSLSEIIQWPCPDVVGTARMARSDDSWISEWSATQQEKLFCGISPSDSKEPPHVMLDLSQEHLNQSDITFDIDSVSAYLSSLAAARCGIRWYPSQPPVSSLRSSLHLDPIPVQYVDHDGKHHSVNVPLHQVNHIALGRVVGLEDASIYVFFPGLYRPNQRTNRLRDYEFQIWMDEIVLPAIHQCYSGSELQHYPSSFRHGQANSWAAWAEGRSIHTQSRQQLLSYFVPAEQLNRLWEKMLQIIKERHLTGFDHLLLFLDAKNLKLSTKARTWAAMRTWF